MWFSFRLYLCVYNRFIIAFLSLPKYLLLHFVDYVIPTRSNRSSQSADAPLWLVRCKLLARLNGRTFLSFVCTHPVFFFCFSFLFLCRTQSPRTRVVLINKRSPLGMKCENSCRKRERRPFLFFLSLSLSLSGGTKEGYRDGRKR